jgi:hypothetical protein
MIRIIVKSQVIRRFRSGLSRGRDVFFVGSSRSVGSLNLDSGDIGVGGGVSFEVNVVLDKEVDIFLFFVCGKFTKGELSGGLGVRKREGVTMVEFMRFEFCGFRNKI